MFVGAIPKEIVEQAIRVIRIDQWREVFVCCSGSFRIERALRSHFPNLRIHSNDVSLLTCSLGHLAAGRSLDIRFTGSLEFVEDYLGEGAPPKVRAAAVMVALEMTKYLRDNTFSHNRFQHYVGHFPTYLDKAIDKLGDYLEGLHLEGFTGCDFREHARRGIERGAAIVAWPPTYKGGYEKIYKFLKANTQWAEPAYDVFDPKDLPAWVTFLRESGSPFWVGADRPIEGHEPAFAFFSGGNRPVYSYATTDRTSLRVTPKKSKPFRYKPIEPEKLHATSVVQIAEIDSERMAFLRDRYLKLGLIHAQAPINFVVFLDGMLAGGFAYRLEMQAGGLDALFALCDFSCSRERRLAKLIAMLSAGMEPVRRFDIKFRQKTSVLYTPVFTDKPVSMKYRGIFELVTRKPGKLLYSSKVRQQTSSEIYHDWWQRFGARVDARGRSPQAADADRPPAAQGS